MKIFKKKIIGLTGIVVVLIVFLAVGIYSFAEDKNKLRVTFFDVGQGDAIFIQTPEGKDILIDGGPDKKVLAGLSKAMPFYDRNIDLVILTHPHEDHFTGLIDVLERYDVGEVYYSGLSSDLAGFKEFLFLINENKIKLTTGQDIGTAVLGSGYFLDIFCPDLAVSANINNTSLVAKLYDNEISFLFTGDAEVEEEEALINSGFGVDVDILKVGHHGSKTASSKVFLEKVSPEIAAISLGEDNEFGHPSPRTVKRLERSGSQVYRTDISGDIKVIVENNGYYNIVVEK